MWRIKKLSLCTLGLGFMMCLHAPCLAQQKSAYGWALSPRDTIRVLIFFVEIDYEESPELDSYPEGTEMWPKGELPKYADELFDPFYYDVPSSQMTTYYHEISLGNLIMLGDYYPHTITLPYDKVSNSPSALMAQLTSLFGKDSSFVTMHGLTPKDFDFWQKSPGVGKEIKLSLDGFEGVDHVMIIARNYHRIPTDTGQASPASAIEIGGRRSNTYSLFGGGRRFPFGIMKHEVNHLFLGSNNFHSGGGNSPRFLSYFMSLQGGWSMMGAANSSLLTCTAWDRFRLDWKLSEKEHLISARNVDGAEVIADLDPQRGEGEGIYILRDFVRTGDAMRIKLPFIPAEEFQQWLWIENHTTTRVNGSPFDKFQYDHVECTATTPSGLYVQMQVDAEIKEGPGIYQSVNADYLRPIPANGMFDFQWERDTLLLSEFCINGMNYAPYTLESSRENPLSGNHEQEFSYRDFKAPFGEIASDEGLVPMTRRVGEGKYARFNFLGGSDHAFNVKGNTGMALGSNPSTASMLTLLNSRMPRKNDVRNNRKVYLNGIRFDVIEEMPDRALKISVRFDDYILEDSRRWCAPEIVLSNHRKAGADLLVRGKLILDRGETPTRFDAPDTLTNGMLAFTSPTRMQLAQGAMMEVEGELHLLGDSHLEVGSNATFGLNKGGKVLLADQAQVHLLDGSKLVAKGRIKIGRSARVRCHDQETYRLVRSRTWQKRRVFHEAGSQT